MSPYDVLELELTRCEKLTLLALLKHANKNGACYPGIETIARLGSQGSSSVSRSLEALEKKGYISRRLRTTNKGRMSTLYQLSLNPTVGFSEQKTATDTQSPNPTVGFSEQKTATDTQSPNPTVGFSEKPSIDYNAYMAFYNAKKPAAWSAIDLVNDYRQSKIRTLVKKRGHEGAFTAFRHAVLAVAGDRESGVPPMKWWSEQTNLNFETIFRSNNLQTWVEAYRDAIGKPRVRLTAPANDLAAVLAGDYGHN